MTQAMFKALVLLPCLAFATWLGHDARLSSVSRDTLAVSFGESHEAQEVLGQSGGPGFPRRPLIAMVTTALHPGASFQKWLDHHLNKCGVDKIMVYMDDPLERSTFEDLVGNRNVELCTGAQSAQEMTPESRIMVRQEANVRNAIDVLLRQRYEWLLHIDTDELLHEAGGPTWWSRLEGVGLVHFTNHEAVPMKRETDDLFNSTFFRMNGASNKEFMAYGNGKSAVRLSIRVEPAGPHGFEGYLGDVLEIPANETMILHYPTPTFSSWIRKYKHYGDFSGYWFNDRYSPIRLDFMLESRDLVQQALRSGNWEETKAFFWEHCLLDPGVQSHALAKGVVQQINPFLD